MLNALVNFKYRKKDQDHHNDESINSNNTMEKKG